MVVFDFAIGGGAGGGEAAGGAEAETGEGCEFTHTKTRHRHAQTVRAGKQGETARNLLAHVVPIAVPVPINPGIELATGRGVDGQGDGLPLAEGRDVDSVFVRTVAGGGGVRLSVGFSVSGRPQHRPHCLVPCPVLRKRHWIARREARLRSGWRIAKVEWRHAIVVGVVGGAAKHRSRRAARVIRVERGIAALLSRAGHVAGRARHANRIGRPSQVLVQ